MSHIHQTPRSPSNSINIANSSGIRSGSSRSSSSNSLKAGLFSNSATALGASDGLKCIGCYCCNHLVSYKSRKEQFRPPKWGHNIKLFSSISLLILILSSQSILCQATLTKRAITHSYNNNNNNNNNEATNDEQLADCHHHNKTSLHQQQQPESIIIRPQNHKSNSTIKHHSQKQQQQRELGKLGAPFGSFANDSKQTVNRKPPPASPSRQQRARSRGLCTGDGGNCHNNQQPVPSGSNSHKMAKQARQQQHHDRPANNVVGCSRGDCLLAGDAPVQAIIGDERIISDLIIPQMEQNRPSKQQQQQQQQQQQSTITGNRRQRAYYNNKQQTEAPVIATVDEANVVAYESRPSYSQGYHNNNNNHYYYYHQQQQQQHYQPQPATNFGPHSDDKCPMTGPLTVCDQIGSYPVEAILSKLNSAKRVLKQSYFNLDSLFSDEREHSSEPFGAEDAPMSPPIHSAADGNTTTTTATIGPADVSLNNFSHHTINGNGHYGRPMNYANQQVNYVLVERGAEGGGGNGKGEKEFGLNGELAVDKKHRPLDYHTVRSYGSSMDNDSPSGDRSGKVGRKNGMSQSFLRAGEQGWLDTDEFVNLVKQRAISISAHDASPSTSTLKANGRNRKEVVVESNKVDLASYQQQQQQQQSNIDGQHSGNSPVGTPTNHKQKQQQQLRYNRKQEVPIIILGKVLAERLLSMGDSLSKQPEFSANLDHNTDRSYQSYQTALSTAESAATGHTFADKNTTAAATANNAHPAASNLSSKSRSRKRPRRQVDVEPRFARPELFGGSGGSDSGQQQSAPATGGGGGNSAPAVVDPERVSEAANGGQLSAEPVCRAKSIYISPRAALNDKKQWKYVVNAAERDPQIRQIIRVDICEDPLGPCSDQFTVPFGFTSQCKQKYSKKKLLALDSQSGLLEVDTFFIPSCCVCQLVRDRLPPEGPEEGDRDSNSSGSGQGGGNSQDDVGPNGGTDRNNNGSSSSSMGPNAPGEPPQAETGDTGDSSVSTPTSSSSSSSFESDNENDTGFDSVATIATTTTTITNTAAMNNSEVATEQSNGDPSLGPRPEVAVAANSDAVGSGEANSGGGGGGNR